MLVSSTPFKSTLERRALRGMFDNGTMLRDYSASALSATGSDTGIAFASTGFEAFKVVFSIAAYSSYSAGSAYWTITVEASTSLASGYSVVATVPNSAGAALETEVVLGGDQVNDIVAGATYLRVTATKTSTPGNLTYGAWLVPVEC